MSGGTARAAAQQALCSHCEAFNQADQRFCSSCGESLWERCLACGTECSGAETFCGDCGANLRELQQQQHDEFAAAFRKAAQLESEFQFDRALAVFKKLSLPTDSRFATQVQQARDRIAALQTKLQQHCETVELGVEHLRGLLAANHDEHVVKLIEKLPPGLRNEETDKLLRDAKSRIQAVETLKADIRGDIENKNFLDLAPKVERLVKLRPDSETAQKLAVQVRSRLVGVAKKYAQQFNFQQAAETLARVPPCAIDDGVRRFERQLRELNWLKSDLQYSPIVDDALRQIAKRYADKVPNDKDSISLCRNIQRRATSATANVRFSAPPWISPPQRPFLGCQVEWLTGAQQVEIATGATASWQQHPGSFFVAIGLALQGLDRAQIATNLLAAEKSGLLGKLAFSKRKATDRAWGIDVGETGMKAVLLAPSPQTQQVQVIRCAVYPHRLVLSQPGAIDHRSELIRETLDKFSREQTIEKTDRVCVSFSHCKVMSRCLKLPSAPIKKLTEMVRFEARQAIPIALDELVLSHHLFACGDGENHDSPNPSCRALLMAAKRLQMDELLKTFAASKLPLHVVQSDAVALANFAMFEGLDELAEQDAKETGAVAILDIGAAATNIVVVHKDNVWLRSIRFGGDDFTDAAIRALRVTRDQAESVKQLPTRARCISQLYEQFDPLLAQLTREIQRSFQAYTKEFETKVTWLAGVGGGFRLHGLMRHLRTGP